MHRSIVMSAFTPYHVCTCNSGFLRPALIALIDIVTEGKHPHGI